MNLTLYISPDVLAAMLIAAGIAYGLHHFSTRRKGDRLL